MGRCQKAISCSGRTGKRDGRGGRGKSLARIRVRRIQAPYHREDRKGRRGCRGGIPAQGAGPAGIQEQPQTEPTLPNPKHVGPGFVNWLRQQFGWLFAKGNGKSTLGLAFAYDENANLLGEYDNGSALGRGKTEYIWLPVEGGQAIPIGMYRNGKFYQLHADHLGTPRLATDSANQPVWQWPYSAFGNNKPTGVLSATTGSNGQVALKASKAPVELNLGFPRQYSDVESGLSYNYFRTYCATCGRFTQADPIGWLDGPNKFLYAGADPLGGRDPLGLLTSAEAFVHYMGRSGMAMEMGFDEIDTSPVKPSQFPRVSSELQRGCQEKHVQIDDRKAFSTTGDAALTVGNITLRLKGKLDIECDCSWKFTGTLGAFTDRYDFNASTHRSRVAEALTFVGRILPGVEFDINIRGTKPVSENGHL